MDLLRRTLSAAILVPLLALVVRYAPAWVFVAVITAVILLSAAEWSALAGLGRGARIAALPALLSLPAGLHSSGDRFWGVWLLLLLLTAAAIGVLGRGEPRERLRNVQGVVCGALFVAAPLSCFTLLRRLDEGRGLVFFLLITLWLVDTAAYAAGATVGRRRLAPLLSPKKTVEGLAGGLVAGGAGGAVCGVLLLGTHAAVGAGSGVLLALLGQLGDLFESLWKRASGAKDSGALIPGHGGMLDRVDSFLLTAPATYYGWRLVQAWS